MGADEIWQQGVTLLEQGDAENAEAAFEQACRLDGRSAPDYVTAEVTPQLWLKRGRVFLRLNAFSASRDCLLKACESAPDLFEAWLNLGIVSLRLNESEAAVPYLERALELEPDSPKALQWQANALNLVGRHEHAREAADACLTFEPSSVFARVMRGQANEKTGCFADAVDDYRRALELSSGNNQLEALLIRALTAAMASDAAPSQVLDFCQELREAVPEWKPNYQASFLHEGFAHQALGQVEAAQDCFERAMQLRVEGADMALAESLHAMGQTDRALSSLSRGRRPAFWRRVLPTLSREQLGDCPQELEDEQLGELLNGHAEILPEFPTLIRVSLELEDGVRLRALIQTEEEPGFLAIHRDHYEFTCDREPPEALTPPLEQSALTEDLEQLHISELTLARARVKSLSDLSGIERCVALEALSVYSAKPFSLAPLAGLEKLESLQLGPPREDLETATLTWSLVGVEALEGLPQLRRLELPIDPRLNPEYQQLLSRLEKHSAADSPDPDQISYADYPETARLTWLEQLGTALHEALAPLFSRFGLSESDSRAVFEKLSVGAVYLTSPACAVSEAELFPEPVAAGIADLADTVAEGLHWDKDAFEATQEWIGLGYGAAFISFLSKILPEVTSFFLARLREEPLQPPTVNWFGRQVEFERSLTALGPFDGEPILDLEHCTMTWTEQGVMKATCWVTLLGTHDPRGGFQAGWCDPIANKVAPPRLGVPALARVDSPTAMALAVAIASSGDIQVVREVKNPAGTLYVGLSRPVGVEPEASPDEFQPGVADRELLGRLQDIVALLQSTAAHPQAEALNLVANLSQEMRRRARLYWHGTRAGAFYEELSEQLDKVAGHAPDRLREELETSLVSWQAKIQQWNPIPAKLHP